MSTYCPRRHRSVAPSFLNLLGDDGPSKPAFWTIWRRFFEARRIRLGRPFVVGQFAPSSAFMQRISATPPPATIPSSTAARVAFRRPRRALFLLLSISVAAPTMITRRRRRSWPAFLKLSRRNRISSLRSRPDLLHATFDLARLPAPSTIVVVLSILTCLHGPGL